MLSQAGLLRAGARIPGQDGFGPVICPSESWLPDVSGGLTNSVKVSL